MDYWKQPIRNYNSQTYQKISQTYQKIIDNKSAMETNNLDNSLFDWKQYIENYTDLKEDGINTREKAFEHWTKYGKKEGRTYKKLDTNLNDEILNIDWEQYIDNYDDLKESGINTKEKAIEHWIKYGKNEGRDIKLINYEQFEKFDWEQYIDNYDDLKESGIDTKEKAIYHWTKHGKNEGRTFENINNHSLNLELFDWEDYINNYNDLKKKGVDTKEKAIEHLVNHGIKEGRIFKYYEEEILNNKKLDDSIKDYSVSDYDEDSVSNWDEESVNNCDENVSNCDEYYEEKFKNKKLDNSVSEYNEEPDNSVSEYNEKPDNSVSKYNEEPDNSVSNLDEESVSNLDEESVINCDEESVSNYEDYMEYCKNYKKINEDYYYESDNEDYFGYNNEEYHMTDYEITSKK